MKRPLQRSAGFLLVLIQHLAALGNVCSCLVSLARIHGAPGGAVVGFFALLKITGGGKGGSNHPRLSCSAPVRGWCWGMVVPCGVGFECLIEQTLERKARHGHTAEFSLVLCSEPCQV